MIDNKADFSFVSIVFRIAFAATIRAFASRWADGSSNRYRSASRPRQIAIDTAWRSPPDNFFTLFGRSLSTLALELH